MQNLYASQVGWLVGWRVEKSSKAGAVTWWASPSAYGEAIERSKISHLGSLVLAASRKNPHADIQAYTHM